MGERTPELIARRTASLAPTYRLFYETPIHLVRGQGVLVYDADGAEYLDFYNNVPSVGHAHPRVVDAVETQMSTLSTHTRYLHENVIELAERLADLSGGGLQKCWFTCTGTESNDLAIQVARVVTGNRGVVVYEGAYHGNSDLVRSLSPSSCPPSERPDWVVAVEPPNAYRGQLPGDDAVAWAALVEDAVVTLDERGHGVAALLIDPSQENNGLPRPPTGYLSRVAEIVHRSGGLVISDEVQAGYCRLGTWWGYQRDGIVPDMVTTGKPMAAGHPVGSVIATEPIADAFASQRSYFNTFGGNPVSAAAALAVLDVIEEEELLLNARTTGAYLRNQLDELADRHAVIGAIQGSGLFWGIDLVSSRDTREPLDSDVVANMVSEAAARGLLVGTVGRDRNIVKVRPPLPVQPSHVDRAIGILDEALASHGSPAR